MRKLTIALATSCLLACGGPAEPVVTIDPPQPGAPEHSLPTAASIAPAPPAAEAGVDPKQFETVHRYTRMFYEGQLDTLYERFSEGMAESFDREQLSTLYEQVGQLYGQELSVLGEETKSNDGYRAFVRWARFEKTEEIIEVQWILNREGEIAGFFVRPAQRKTTSKAVPVETPK